MVNSYFKATKHCCLPITSSMLLPPNADAITVNISSVAYSCKFLLYSSVRENSGNHLWWNVIRSIQSVIRQKTLGLRQKKSSVLIFFLNYLHFENDDSKNYILNCKKKTPSFSVYFKLIFYTNKNFLNPSSSRNNYLNIFFFKQDFPLTKKSLPFLWMRIP